MDKKPALFWSPIYEHIAAEERECSLIWLPFWKNAKILSKASYGAQQRSCQVWAIFMRNWFGMSYLKLERAFIGTSVWCPNDCSLQFQIAHTKPVLHKNGSNLARSLLSTIWSFAENPSDFSKKVTRLLSTAANASKQGSFEICSVGRTNFSVQNSPFSLSIYPDIHSTQQWFTTVSHTRSWLVMG